MKFITIYPSTVMRVVCPHCGGQGKVKREKPPQEDFTVACPGCKEKFLVKINVRSFYRKSVSIPVHYSPSGILRPDDPRALEGNIVDISQQGMRVEVNEQDFSPGYHKEGNIFTFLFSLPPRKELLKVQGEVARTIEEARGGTLMIGVRFSNLDHYTNRQIGFFLLP